MAKEEKEPEKANCRKCNAENTFDRLNGYCAPCHKKSSIWNNAKNGIEIFGGITSGIFGATIGAVLGYAILGIWGAVIGGILLFVITS